jgi:aqualysin 1
MKVFQYCLVAGLLLLAACSDNARDPISPTDNSGEAPTFSKSDAGQDLTDRYIVVFKENVANSDELVDKLMEKSQGRVHFRYRYAIKGFAATIPEQALEGIRHNPNVDYIEADGIVTTTATQSNPPNWGLDRVDQHALPLNQQYIYQNNGTDVTVYIIDSGIRMDHQEYSGRVTSGWDFIDNDPDATDCHGHGTHVAGTVGGSWVGIAKAVNLVAVRVLNCNGSGSYSQVIAGIDWVTVNHASPAVANMSLGGGYSSSLNQAVNNSVAAGVVYAVSAGNSNANACNYSPASAASALTVGSTTSSDNRSSFSNYGTCVDIFAPGSGIYSSTRNSTSSYASWSGTSMASPHVAGVAALYLSANPSATPAQVESAIKTGATSGVLSGIGSGSPNLLLYSLITGPAPPPPTPPAAPTGLGLSNVTTSSIDLNWTDNASNEDGFKVQRSLNGSTWSDIATLGVNATSYSNTGLSSGVLYYYRVYAFNTGGNSGFSNTASATTLLPPAPAAPTSLVLSNVTTSSIDLNWTDNASNEDGFRVQRSLNGSTWSNIATLGVNATSYSNTGLSSGVLYYYRVYAFNAGGNSGNSNTASATTLTQTTTTVHVGALSGTASRLRNRWYGYLHVTVHDSNGNPVQGVTVSVSWPGGSGSAVSDGSGNCTVKSSKQNYRKVSSLTMSVTNMSGSSIVYDSGANVATSRTISRP